MQGSAHIPRASGDVHTYYIDMVNHFVYCKKNEGSIVWDELQLQGYMLAEIQQLSNFNSKQGMV